MSKIVILRKHALPLDEVRTHIEALAEKLGKTLDASYEWQGDELNFKRKGATGKISFDEKQVDMSVELGLLLRPMKGQITKAINEYLDEYLG
jgi:putative polyhydroxyalkanoate system protein